MQQPHGGRSVWSASLSCCWLLLWTFAETSLWQLISLPSHFVSMRVALGDRSCSTPVVAGQLAQPACPDADRSSPPLIVCWPPRKVLQEGKLGARGLLPMHSQASEV